MGEMFSNSKITIGYIAPFIWGDLTSSLIKGISEKAEQLDVNLICIMGQNLSDTSKEFTRQANTVYDLVDKEYIDGIVMWSSEITKDSAQSEIKKFYDKFESIPIVNVVNPVENGCNVFANDKKGIRVIMEHLILDHKYQKIGFIRANRGNIAAEKRFEEYKQCLEDFNLPYKPELVSNYNKLSIDGGKTGTKQLFQKRRLEPVQDIEAIVTPNDILAIGVSEELRQLGIRCPDEIAVVGFENKFESKICKPSLTSVDLSFTQQGNVAVGMLVDILKNNPTERNINIHERLIIRNSCGCKEIDLNDLSEADNCIMPFEITNEQIDKMVKNIQRKVTSFYYTVDSSWVENMVSSFIYDIKNPKAERFIATLELYLDIICSQNEDISNFQNVITLFRNEISPIIKNHESLLRATDIWNRARIIVTHASEAAAFSKILRDDKAVLATYFTEHRLMSTFTLKEFLEAMELIVKDGGIKSCYIATYNRQEDLLRKAKLIFAYNENGRIMIAKDYYFNPKEIVPKELRPSERRYTYIVNSLYYKNVQLGFAVYETDVKEQIIFGTLSTQISNALYRINMFKRLKESEFEKEALFKKIQSKNLELESKIQERTAAVDNMNKELKKAIFKLNNANEAKNKFLATISNEIRIPLNCIIGFTDILKSADIEQYKKYISIVGRESEKMLDLINEIFDISRIESGKLTLNREIFDMHSCIEYTTSIYCSIAQTKGLYYHVYGLDIIPNLLMGDAVRLKQILANILSNAVKYTDSGGITVSLEIAEETETEIEILFNVNDTGSGIPIDQQKSIFEDYSESKDSLSYNGTGLGLAVSKQLVELMGGKIGVDSIENEGSTFWFTANFEKVLNNHMKKDNEYYGENNKINIFKDMIAGSTVLLVENYPSNIELAKVYLTNIGCKVIEAISGKEAIKLFKENSVDLAMIDVQIPEINGCQVAKDIRKLQRGINVPIIAIADSIFEYNIIEYMTAGIDDIITKPFKKSAFEYKIILWLSKSKNFNNFVENEHVIGLKPYIEDSESEFDDMQYIDIEKNLNELDNDEKMFLNVSKEFFDRCNEKLIDIKESIKNQKYTGIESEIEFIKDGALNLSAKPMSEKATALTDKIKNRDLKDIETLIKNLEMTIIKTEVYLKTKLN